MLLVLFLQLLFLVFLMMFFDFFAVVVVFVFAIFFIFLPWSQSVAGPVFDLHCMLSRTFLFNRCDYYCSFIVVIVIVIVIVTVLLLLLALVIVIDFILKHIMSQKASNWLTER